MHLVSWNFYALAQEDLPRACTECSQKNQATILLELEKSESSYAEYRWVQRKIRRLYYGPLWQSRIDGNDPLDKVKREVGKRDEEKLMAVLESYEKRSDLLSNQIVQSLDEIRNSDGAFSKCHSQPVYTQCIQGNLEKINSQITDFKKHFDHYFESSRDFLKEVSQTAGSKRGLYPSDAIERPVDHSDYATRYDYDRAALFYEEEDAILQSYEKIRRLITEEMADSNCCYQADHPDLAEEMETLHA